MKELKPLNLKFYDFSFKIPFLSQYASLKTSAGVLVGLALLTAHSGTDYFFAQRFGLMELTALIACLFFAKRYGILVGLFFGYCMTSALWASMWRDNMFTDLGPGGRILIKEGVLQGLLSALLSLSAIVIAKKWVERVLLSFGVYVCIHMWILKYFYFWDGHLMTPTLACVFLVLLIPLCLKIRWLPLVFSITVIAHGGYTAIASLGALVLGYACFHWPRLIFWGVADLFSIGFALFQLPSIKLMIMSGKDRGRFHVWPQVLDWFWSQDHHWFGIGAGTVYSLIPILQQKVWNDTHFMWIYLHNEYLQGFVELGIVGMCLCFLIYGLNLYQNFQHKDKNGFAFMTALIPASFAMFPFRHDTILLLVLLQFDRIWAQNRPKDWSIS